MARAYQEAHVMQTLQSDVKNLTTAVLTLSKDQRANKEEINALTTQNAVLANQVSALETRAKANEYNTTARLRNLHAYLSSTTNTPTNAPPPGLGAGAVSGGVSKPKAVPTAKTALTLSPQKNFPLAPLHSTLTNRPIPNCPKNMNAIKTMAPPDVIQVLQALGVSILGQGGAAERKGRLRSELGIPREDK